MLWFLEASTPEWLEISLKAKGLWSPPWALEDVSAVACGYRGEDRAAAPAGG